MEFQITSKYNFKTKIVKKILILTSYEEASSLTDTLQFLKNLKDPNNIFLDYNATTKGIFKKTYKFKIYYKYEVILLKSIVERARAIHSEHVKHLLHSLLQSYLQYKQSLPFMGNISLNTIIVYPAGIKSSKVMKSSLLDANFVSNLLDYKAKLIFTHVDKISKNEWVQRKVASLRHNHKILIEPCLIPKFLEYNQELDAGKEPQGEDFVNKKYMVSNDIFCLVFSLLIMCDKRFAKCYSYVRKHSDCLVKFNREYFKDLFNDLMFSVSDDKNLVFVLKKLLDIEKYKSGNLYFWIL